MKVALLFITSALAGLKIKAQQGSTVAADANLIAAVRAEAREHMRAMLGKSFLQFPKPLDANGLKNSLYATQQLRGPASGINVVEKRGDVMLSGEAVALKKKFYLALAGKSFLARPHQEVNIAISSFLQNQQQERAMQEGEDRRSAFIDELFSSQPIITVGLSPAPEGLGSSFLSGDGVRLQVASGPAVDEAALRRAKNSFLGADVRVQAGSRHWPKLSDVASYFLGKGPDMSDVEKVLSGNLAAAQAYSQAGGAAGAGSAGSIHSFVESPADAFLKKLIQRRGTEGAGQYSRSTQSPMVWMRFH